MKTILIFVLFVFFSGNLFSQDGWDNWKPYSSESYYEVNQNSQEHSVRTKYDIFNPRFYVSKMQNRFLSVDRFADKYPSISPYHYTLNNPINFIDVNGDSVWINYTDSDGNAQRILYTQGMEYSGGNKQVANIISVLNKISSLSSGNKVISTLVCSSNNYFVGFGALNNPNASAQYRGNTRTLTFTESASGRIEAVAHEIFHAYQHENNSPRGSIHSEVEAYLFGVTTAWGLGEITGAIGRSNDLGELYRQNFISLTSNFSLPNFLLTRKYFTKGSVANSKGIYTGRPIIHPGEPYLLPKLYPLGY